MSELHSGSVNSSSVPTPREMLTVLDDITGQAIFANAVELDLVLHKYDYRQLAHQFAEQLRREEPQQVAGPARRDDSIRIFPTRHDLDRAS